MKLPIICNVHEYNGYNCIDGLETKQQHICLDRLVGDRGLIALFDTKLCDSYDVTHRVM